MFRLVHIRSVLLATVLFGLSACGGGGGSSPSRNQPPTNPPTNPPVGSSSWDTLRWDTDNWS